jgi:hypothetical protein
VIVQISRGEGGYACPLMPLSAFRPSSSVSTSRARRSAASASPWAGVVQRQGQQPPALLAHRVLAHQGLELCDDGRAALRGQRQLGPPQRSRAAR